MNRPGGGKLARAGQSQTCELAHGAVGSARVTAFGVSNVAPSGAVVGGLVHVAIGGWALYLVILAAVAGVAYLGIGTSSWVDLALVAGEMAVIAALAVSVLVKIGPAHYSATVLSPASSPNGQFTDITDAMIYGITAFAGFETAAALGEEARSARRSIPASTIGIVIVTGLFYLLVVCAETFGVGRHGIPGLTRQHNPLGYLTSRYWSPSALWAIDLVVVLTGLGFVTTAVNAIIRILFAMGRERVLPVPLARLSRRHTPAVAIGCVTGLTLVLGLPLTYACGGARTFGYLAGAAGLSVVLIYLAVNISVIRAFRTGFRSEFTFWRHLVIPAAAVVFFLFPLWGILHPRSRALMDLLPFAALGWLGLGFIAAGVLRARQPARLEALGRVFRPTESPSPG
jgi:amino acid transporter